MTRLNKVRSAIPIFSIDLLHLLFFYDLQNCLLGQNMFVYSSSKSSVPSSRLWNQLQDKPTIVQVPESIPISTFGFTIPTRLLKIMRFWFRFQLFMNFATFLLDSDFNLYSCTEKDFQLDTGLQFQFRSSGNYCSGVNGLSETKPVPFLLDLSVCRHLLFYKFILRISISSSFLNSTPIFILIAYPAKS